MQLSVGSIPDSPYCYLSPTKSDPRVRSQEEASTTTRGDTWTMSMAWKLGHFCSEIIGLGSVVESALGHQSIFIYFWCFWKPWPTLFVCLFNVAVLCENIQRRGSENDIYLIDNMHTWRNVSCRNPVQHQGWFTSGLCHEWYYQRMYFRTQQYIMKHDRFIFKLSHCIPASSCICSMSSLFQYFYDDFQNLSINKYWQWLLLSCPAR